MALVCNCRRVVGRVEPGYRAWSEWRVVKSRLWDCPSCGLDRKRTLAQMCGTAGVTRMLTLTFSQPRVPGDLLSGGRLPSGHVAYRPDRHRLCDWDTHGYWYVPPPRRELGVVRGEPRRPGWRWRIVPACAHCCAWVSAALGKWRKRVRRRFPDVQYLHAREVHKSGALHVHVAVVGLPATVTRRSLTGKALKAQWQAVGGGWLDVGRHGEDAGTDAGWYVGKYLAKSHGEGERFARGYRRWSRTAGFAPDVLMRPRPDPDRDGGWSDPGAPLLLRGWLDPDGVESSSRWWPHATAPAVGLDPRTAKCPGGLVVVLQEACRVALGGVLDAPAPEGCASDALALF